MNRSFASTLFATGLAVILFATDARAILIRHDVPIAEYNALALDPQFQSAGYFYGGINRATFNLCSGTLVAPTLFLTAAHCVGDLTPSDDSFIGFGNDFNLSPRENVSGIHINPHWRSSTGEINRAADLAILELFAPLTGIVPAPILLFNPSGAGVVSFGYGRQGYGTGTDPYYTFPDHLPGAQNRLAARNIIDTISDDFYVADFDAPPPPLGAARLEGGWASGDSGGPLFLPFRIDSGPLTNYLIGDLSAVSFETGTRDDIYGISALWTRFSNPLNEDFLRGFDELTIVRFRAPEPGTLALVVLLLPALVFTRRRKQ